MATFVEPIQDVSTRGLSPVRAVQDNTTAEAIGALGNIGLDMFKGKTVADAGSQFAQIEEDFQMGQVAAPNKYELGQLKDMTSYFQRLKGLADDGRLDEYKLRAEAELKKQIQAYPGLADDFRRIAAEEFGFDPTGYQKKKQLQDLADQTFDAKKAMESIDADAVRTHGMIPGEVYTEDGERKYLALNAITQQASQLESAAKLNKASGKMVDQLQLRKQTLTNDSIKLDKQLSSLVKPLLDKYNIGATPSASDILRMTPQEKKDALQALTDLQEKTDNYYFQLDGIKQHEVKYFQEAINTVFKPYIDLIKGDSSLEENASIQKLKDSVMATQLFSDHKLAIQRVLVNHKIEIPNLVKAENVKSQYATIRTLLQNNYQPPIEQANQADPKEYRELASSILNRFKKIAANPSDTSEETKRGLAGLLVNTSNYFIENKGKYKKSMVDEWIKAFAEPTNLPMLSQLFQQEPKLTESMSSLIKEHTKQTYIKVAGQLKVGGESSRYIKPSINPNTGLPEFVIMEELLNRGLGGRKRMSDTDKDNMRKIINTDLNKLNNIIKSTSTDGLQVFMTINGFKPSQTENVIKQLLQDTDVGREIWPQSERDTDAWKEQVEGLLPSGNTKANDGADLQNSIQPLLQKSSESTGVPLDIINKQLGQESSFNPAAVSETNVKGLIQMTRATATEMGFDPDVVRSDNPEDLPVQIDAYSAYMGKLMEQFDGDVQLALLAYNSGPSAAEKWRDEGITPRKQGVDYVKKISGSPLKKYNT